MWHPILSTPSPCRAGASRRSSGASDLIELLPDEAHHDPLLGRGILKSFSGKDYYGHVVGIDADPVTGERFYHVTYEDGDEEHMPAAEVVKFSHGQPIAPPPSGRPSFSCSRAATPRFSRGRPALSGRPSFSASRAGTPRTSNAWLGGNPRNSNSHDVHARTLQTSDIGKGFECCLILLAALCGVLIFLWLLPDGLSSSDGQDSATSTHVDLLDLGSVIPSWETSFVNTPMVELSLPNHRMEHDLPDVSANMIVGNLHESDAEGLQPVSYPFDDSWVEEIALPEESETSSIAAHDRDAAVEIDWFQTDQKLSPDDVKRWAATAGAALNSSVEEFFSSYGDDAVTLLIGLGMVLSALAFFVRDCFKASLGRNSVLSLQQAQPPSHHIDGSGSPGSLQQQLDALSPAASMANSSSRPRVPWPAGALFSNSPVLQSQNSAHKSSPLPPSMRGTTGALAADPLMTPVQPQRSSPQQHADVQMSPIAAFRLPTTTPGKNAASPLSSVRVPGATSGATTTLPVQLGAYYVARVPGDQKVAKAISMNAAKDEVTLQICEANRKRFKLSSQTAQVSAADLLHGPFALCGGYLPRHVPEIYAEAMPAASHSPAQPPTQAPLRLRNRYLDLPQQRFRFTSSLHKMVELGFEDTPELRDLLTRCSGNVNEALRQFWSDE